MKLSIHTLYHLVGDAVDAKDEWVQFNANIGYSLIWNADSSVTIESKVYGYTQHITTFSDHLTYIIADLIHTSTIAQLRKVASEIQELIGDDDSPDLHP